MRPRYPFARRPVSPRALDRLLRQYAPPRRAGAAEPDAQRPEPVIAPVAEAGPES